MAIKIGTNRSAPGSGVNFIGFFGANTLIGQVEGSGRGSVVYKTTGADYAEYLPQLDKIEYLGVGDVVGVYAGQITHNTVNAAQVMVITDRAAVLGNMPKGQDMVTQHHAVSFIGQVPVKVRGAVKAGDAILASGRQDGTGIAVPAYALTMQDQIQIVGRAWESSDDVGLKKVMVAIGLDHTDMAMIPVRQLQAAYKTQQQEIASLHQELQQYRSLAAELHEIIRQLAEIPQLLVSFPK